MDNSIEIKKIFTLNPAGLRFCRMMLSLVVLMSFMVSAAYATSQPRPAGNCPAFNGVDNAAPPISPDVLTFTETGGLTKVISVVTSDQSAPSTGDSIVPGVMMICKYPIVGGNADTSTITGITATYNGNNGLWAAKIGCGSGDCARIGRKTGDGNSNNMPMNGGTYTAGSVTFSSEPDSELIVAHINWPQECGDSGDDDGDGNPETCFRTLQEPTSVPEFPTIALPIATLIGMLFLVYRLRK
ncbi:MAG: PEF-CTERM sorting domain-containing protein [Candidatus Methanoperedens sp.]|nr:PEF-CTERM sorting domain-containing protein [Candidatus Methanoperedens sp.]